jgi:hypothetical protein
MQILTRRLIKVLKHSPNKRKKILREKGSGQVPCSHVLKKAVFFPFDIHGCLFSSVKPLLFIVVIFNLILSA